MSKKILEVSFVNFGDERERCAFRVTAFTDGFHHLAETLFSIHSEPQIYGKSFASLRGDVQTWVYNLNNSGDAPVPRIEKSEGSGYRLYRSGEHTAVGISGNTLKNLNQIYGKEAEIHTPKKYEAKWVQIFPRKIAPEEVLSSAAHDNFMIETQAVLTTVFELQQTEANGLEVWGLTVYEESANG